MASRSAAPQTINKDTLEFALRALERLLAMFTLERYVYLALTSLSFLLLLYIGWSLLQGNLDKTLLMAVFGSSGLVAASSARIVYIFNRAFNLVEKLINRLQSS